MTINFTILQFDILWENPEQNIKKIKEKIIEYEIKNTLLILPEMFTTGFTMDAENVFETMKGATICELKNISKTNNIAIIGSIIIKEHNNFYNRLLYINENRIAKYDKKHLFKMAGEDKIYERGSEILEITHRNLRIRPLICYDLRFPVWSRNNTSYDVLIYIANWPEKRKTVWKQLLIARAIENQSFVIGVNRIGTDFNGLKYSGNSIIINEKGEIVYEALNKKEDCKTIKISKQEIDKFRNKFPVLEDKDNFNFLV